MLPTNAPYEVKFSKTTTYHWPNFDLNVTENDDKGFDATQQGPFGFGNAVDIDASKQQVKFIVSTSWTLLLLIFQCLVDTDFAVDGDNCIKNPVNCHNGTTVSFFFKAEYHVNQVKSSRI